MGEEKFNQQEAGFSPAGLSPEVCPTDDGQTIRPVRNEGAARERNVVGFDLGGVEDAQEECKVGPHAEEEPNMDCESDGGEFGERVRLLPKPRTPSKAEWERHVVSHVPFRDWCRHCVAGRGLERRHQRHPGRGDATPMLVAKDRRTGMVFALPVERKGAADPHAVEQLAAWVYMLGSSQMAIRSDGEPAVMQFAAAVRDARRPGSVTTLETSAPGDHAGNGLAERAVGLVGGMVRTLKNELEFNCQMQIPPESKTIAWMVVHATTLLNLDTVGPDGKVPFERWRGRGHHMGRCVFGKRVWYRVGPSTDRTKAEDRMEPGIFVGFRMKSSEYILIANGEATTARTIRRSPVPERWTNPEEIVNIPVWPWDRPGHWQAAAVRPMGERRDRNHEPDEALLPKPPAEAGPSKRVYLKQSDFDAHGLTQGCPGCRAMREGIRAQGHSAICRARMEELLRGTAKGQQRLEEAERRTRDTAGERAAKRIKLQFANRPADPVSSSSASRSDATAGSDAASASNVVAGVSLKMLETLSQGVPLQMQLKTPQCREGMTGAEPSHGRQKMTRNERNDNALRIRQNWRWGSVKRGEDQ